MRRSCTYAGAGGCVLRYGVWWQAAVRTAKLRLLLAGMPTAALHGVLCMARCCVRLHHVHQWWLALLTHLLVPVSAAAATQVEVHVRVGRQLAVRVLHRFLAPKVTVAK